LGGADKIAFIKGNDIWLVNLDGSDLTRLTSDGSTKNALQWLPDGSGLVYISGLCIQQVNAETTRVDSIACFEYLSSLDWFAISPDGQQAAIVVNQQLYIIPFDAQQLSQVQYWSEIKAMAPCQDMAPYASSTGTAYAVREARWSTDMQRLALVMLGVEGGRQVDIVRIISIASCIANPASIDEFPSNRFSISGYNTNPTILHLGWDGMFRFGLTGYVRNEGFGDLYFYNLDVHRAELRVNPVNSSCCYRDVSFSPDGSYIAFAFQDINLGAQGTIQLFYIPFGTIGTGLQYTPIPLPEDFFTNPRESPQPVLRPVPPLP
jgi:Tol biopolymer transport system component